MNTERRGNWYLLTGLLLGLVLGLAYAWMISPVQYVDTAPVSLSEDYKDHYRQTIALAYQANQDIGRARERAALVDPDNPARALAALAQRLMASSQSPREARALAILAADLGQQLSPAENNPSPQAVAEQASATPDPNAGASPTATLDQSLAIQTATAPLPSATATITLSPTPTNTPRPTATPPRVQDAPFTLVNSQENCASGTPAGLLQVQVTDSSGQPLPGVRIVVSWPDGQDTFFTGLIPEINPGYADFQMQPGVTYSLKVGEASAEISGIRAAANCGWIAEFTQGQ